MSKPFPQPIDSVQMPRFGAVATFMRLPLADDPHALDIALAGVPWDGGTTNRPGARHGPRQVRDLSSMMRRVHPTTGLEPYQLAEYAIEATAEFEPGYEPEYAMGEFNNRMKVIGDESEVIYNLVMQMDPEAGAALRQGLDDFEGF